MLPNDETHKYNSSQQVSQVGKGGLPPLRRSLNLSGGKAGSPAGQPRCGANPTFPTVRLSFLNLLWVSVPL